MLGPTHGACHPSETDVAARTLFARDTTAAISLRSNQAFTLVLRIMGLTLAPFSIFPGSATATEAIAHDDHAVITELHGTLYKCTNRSFRLCTDPERDQCNFEARMLQRLQPLAQPIQVNPGTQQAEKVAGYRILYFCASSSSSLAQPFYNRAI